jgi:hypothetical protein
VEHKPDLNQNPIEWQLWADMVITDTNNERRNKWLGMIHDVDELRLVFNRKNNPATYGQMRDFEVWCSKQGHGIHPPHKAFRIHVSTNKEDWGIPMWLVAIVSTAIFFGALFAGAPLKVLMFLLLGSYLALLFTGFFFAGYEYDKVGLCHQCGITLPKRPGLKKINWRGKEVYHTKASLCNAEDENTNNCEWIHHRYDMAHKLRNQRWDSIKMNRVRGLIFRVYKDKITNIEYTNADRNIPLDEGDDQMLDNAERDFVAGLEKLAAIRRRKRFQFVKRKTNRG